MKKLILIGGGGHCKACIDVIEQEGLYKIEGILDHADFIGKDVLGYRFIGTDKDILKYTKLSFSFLITVGQIKSAQIRKKIYQVLEDCNASLATVISPRAYVSRHAVIEKGTIIMHHAFVNAAAKVGINCILNTGCNVEHDSTIGNHTHLSTFAVVNGNCSIGNDVFIGSNATISNQVTLKDSIVIGSGAVVVRNIEEPGIYIGNPTRKMNL